MTRVEQINAAVRELRTIHDKWANDNQGGLIPSVAMLDGIERLKAVLDAGICPKSHIGLNNAMVALWNEFRFWDMRDDLQNREPRQSFWSAMGGVFDQLDRLTPKPSPPLPSVSTLLRQGSTHEQIARYVYGFLTSDGKTYDEDGNRHAGPLMTDRDQVDVQKLEAEAATPGSVIPAGWMNPVERSRLEAVGFFDETPAVRMDPVERSHEDRVNQAVQLMSEGATTQQVINCTGLAENEIRTIAADHSLPSPDPTPNSQPVSDDALEAKILDLAATIPDPVQILTELRSQGIPTNIYRVKQTLAKVSV